MLFRSRTAIDAVALTAIEKVLEKYVQKELEQPSAPKPKRKFLGIDTSTGALLNVDETWKEIKRMDDLKRQKMEAAESKRKERLQRMKASKK
mgnify:CR=1 FL=1